MKNKTEKKLGPNSWLTREARSQGAFRTLSHFTQCGWVSYTSTLRASRLTLVWPNLYWLWSMSREPSNFSAPFLLSMNWPSGMAAGFRMRYLEGGA